MHDDRGRWIAEALERYETPLLRFAAKLLRDPDRARDVVQETFLQLCHQDRSAVEGHLTAWLFRVCRNRALDLLRKETRVNAIEQTSPLGAAAAPDPSVVAQQREDTGHVLRVLETLSAQQQEAVYLRFQSGLSYQEISEITGQSVTNVGFMLHTAIKKIREHVTAPARPLGRTAEGSR